jgi:small subunit ribosomal protein S6e
MAIFKFVISDPKTRRSAQVESDHAKAAALLGRKIGDEFSGDVIGFSGYTLKITGGTDKDGFPMYAELKGTSRRKLLLTGPPSFFPKIKGQRKRKMVCGNAISDSIVQVNAKVVKYGEKPFEELAPKKEKAEAKPDEKAGK